MDRRVNDIMQRFLFLSSLFSPFPSLLFNNIPVSGSQSDHRDAGSLLASGVAFKKDKEQMVVFVIAWSFQAAGKPGHLSLPLCVSFSAAPTALQSCEWGPTSAMQAAS